MRPRSGFTLVEVVIASMVLVIALFGILGAAFNAYRKSDIGDDYQTAALLAAERLDYFRSQRNPYQAVGGTFFDAPADRRQVDFNTDPQVHVIANEQPRLFVKEYLFNPTETPGSDALGQDHGRKARELRNRDFGASGEVALNWIPETPRFIHISNTGDPLVDDPRLDGVVPNTDIMPTGVGLVQVRTGQVQSVITVGPLQEAIGGAGGSSRTFRYIRAPRANEQIFFTTGGAGIDTRGNLLSDLPAAIRFVREVWIQTNHPLGRPTIPAQVDFAPGATGIGAYPAFYTGVATVIPVQASGVQIIPGRNNVRYNEIVPAVIGRTATVGAVPPWTVTVTVRVFARDQRVKSIMPNDTTVGNQVDGPRRAGFGYDPARPLATLVGYFGLRRMFQ